MNPTRGFDPQAKGRRKYAGERQRMSQGSEAKRNNPSGRARIKIKTRSCAVFLFLLSERQWMRTLVRQAVDFTSATQ